MVGSKIGFAPLGEVPGWQSEAPALAGLVERTHEDVVRVLTKGVKANGKPPRPPMPPYGMKEADAQAIAAYLKTLKPK
jgi:mono/diheme cytochrome c family protein